MPCDRIGGNGAAVAAQTQPNRQVDVLQVGEEAFVETPHSGKSRRRDRLHRRMAQAARTRVIMWVVKAKANVVCVQREVYLDSHGLNWA